MWVKEAPVVVLFLFKCLAAVEVMVVRREVPVEVVGVMWGIQIKTEERTVVKAAAVVVDSLMEKMGEVVVVLTVIKVVAEAR